MSEIIISGLIKRFRTVEAVNIQSLKIGRSEVVGFVGNNGAGKTTLFRLILDLLRVDKGSVTIDGKQVNLDENWKQTTGSYIDSGFLIEFLTAEEFFHYVGSVYGLTVEDVDSRLKEYDRFMNGELLGQKKFIRNFSAGNKQKIGIVAAMIVNPQLLILDEPFNFLDPSSQIEIKHLLKNLNEQIGTTILISSHNLDHITDVSSRIVLLEKGVVIKNIDNTSGSAREELQHYFEL